MSLNACAGAALAVSLFGVSTASARTVALWPLETDSVAGLPDGRCANDSAYDLTTHDIAANAANAGWNLPPNPDAGTVWVASPTNRTSLATTTVGSSRLSHPALGEALAVDHDFTLEGWLKIDSLPRSNSWAIISTAYTGNIDGQSTFGFRHLWTIRNRTENAPDGVTVQLNYNSDMVFCVLTDAEVDSLMNAWHHYALVKRCTGRDGRKRSSTWTFYLDGVIKGSLDIQSMSSNDTTDVPSDLCLFGRPLGAHLSCQADYWRLSDVALAPEEFLCAGGSGTQIPEPEDHPTLAYWPLGRRADGSLDGSPAVGTIPLSVGLIDIVGSTDGSTKSPFSPVLESAFAGNPPNPTATLPSGNAGSLFMDGTGGGLAITNSDFIANFSYRHSFTVEGWCRPVRSTADSFDVMYLFQGEFDKNGRWGLMLSSRSKGGIVPELWGNAVNPANSKSETVLAARFDDCHLENRVDWMHVALTYSASEGLGVWRVYVDGQLAGSAENNFSLADWQPGEKGNVGFGRNELVAGGYYDCFRLSGTALSPEQFLCATGATARAATDVIAYWPLNTPDGINFDGVDVAGNWTLQPLMGEAYLAAADADAPTVTNPDSSPACNRRLPIAAGSANFATGLSTVRTYLTTMDPTVLGLFSTTNYTVECYVKRTEEVNAWELLYGSYSRIRTASASAWIQMTYRKTGWNILDNRFMKHPDSDLPLPGSADSLDVGNWHHVAFSAFCDGGTNAVYEVYTDGSLTSTYRTNAFNTTINTGRAFLVGGRPSSANYFRGKIAHLRLSKRRLDPSEFLCASAPAPVVEDPKTRAYWPLDYADGTTDLASRIANRHPFFAAGETFAGQDAVARKRAPNPDTSAEFVGDPSGPNVGSVVLGAGDSLRASNVGVNTDVNRAFTVEGWFKWDGVAPTPRRLCGNWVEDAWPGAGWKLSIAADGGQARFLIFARRRMQTPVVNATIPCSVDLTDDWHHLALTYDPSVGVGIWKLFVDGSFVGSAANLRFPAGWDHGYHRFALGDPASDAQSAAGGYDLWRLSSGALTPDGFLYRPKPGLIVIFR